MIREYIDMSIPHKAEIRDYVFYPQEFKKALDFAEQYKNTNGVREVINNFNEQYAQYKKDTHALADSVMAALDCSYEKMRKSYRQKNICKLLPFAFLVLAIVLSNLNNVLPGQLLGLIVSLLVIFASLGIAVAAILTILFFIKSNISYKQYRACLYDISAKADKILEKYSNEIKYAKNKADELYLNSLDSAHREAVLMRRDQQRQHEEQLELQMQHQQRMEDMQKKQVEAQQRQMDEHRWQAKEQQKMRENQEELLRIEKDRENRYYQNKR